MFQVEGTASTKAGTCLSWSKSKEASGSGEGQEQGEITGSQVIVRTSEMKAIGGFEQRRGMIEPVF